MPPDVGSPRPNLVLTGFMGTGKTTVGLLVAERLGMEFVDTDNEIERRHGPIEAIFAKGGEDFFRSLEHSVASELGERSGLVIATGGGMLLDQDNIASLASNGLVLCLVATPDQIRRRLLVSDPNGRPLLDSPDPGQRISELIEERHASYERFPQVETDDVTPDEVADEVIRRWAAFASD